MLPDEFSMLLEQLTSMGLAVLKCDPESGTILLQVPPLLTDP